MYVDGNNVTYFYSFEVEHTANDTDNKGISTNICRIQWSDSIICGYLFTGLIDFMLRDNSLLDHINIFFLNKYKKKWWNNTKIFLITKIFLYE